MFDLNHVVILVLAAISTCAGVALFFKGAALKVEIANMLLTVSNSLSQYGFTHLAAIAQRLAIGDFAGPSKRPNGWSASWPTPRRPSPCSTACSPTSLPRGWATRHNVPG